MFSLLLYCVGALAMGQAYSGHQCSFLEITLFLSPKGSKRVTNFLNDESQY